MSKNGFGTITFEGSSVRHKVRTAEIADEIDRSTATIRIQSPYISPETFTPENPFVVLKDDEGNIRFHGWVRDWDETDDLAITTYTIWADDPKETYTLSRPIDMFRFPKGTLAKDALQTLITNFGQGDVVATNDIDPYSTFEATIKNTNLSAAIQMILASLITPYFWETTYDEETGKINHHFKELWDESLGTIEDGEGTMILSGKFKWNRQSVRNYVRVQARNISMPKPFLQRVYFRKSSLQTGRAGLQEYRIPLAKKPIGVKVYLMVGEWSSDPVAVSKCKYYDMMVKPLTEGDKGAIIRDVDDALQQTAGYFKIGTVNIATASSLGVQSIETILQDPNLKNSVRQIIIGLYDEDLACYLSTKSLQKSPETVNGYLLCPSISVLKEKAKALKKALGINISPENILGYAISFIVQKDVVRKFTDANSIQARGVKASEVYNLETQDLSTLNYYGQGKLATLKDPILEGEIEAVMYRDGVKYLPIVPKVGRLVNFEHPIRGTVNDINIRSVVTTIGSTDSTCVISARYESPLGMLPQTLKSIETQAGLRQTLGDKSGMEAECTDAIEFADSVKVWTSERKYNCMFNEQPARRLWLR